MDEQTRMLMPAVYCADIKCPFLDMKPCAGNACGKWYELLKPTEKKSSYGKCTAVVYLKEGESVNLNKHVKFSTTELTSVPELDDM